MRIYIQSMNCGRKIDRLIRELRASFGCEVIQVPGENAGIGGTLFGTVTDLQGDSRETPPLDDLLNQVGTRIRRWFQQKAPRSAHIIKIQDSIYQKVVELIL